MRKLTIVLLSLFILFISGCASIPMASLEADERAKRFSTDRDKSNIYIYRNQAFAGLVSMDVTIDGLAVGKTRSFNFIHRLVEPGDHEIVSEAENTARIKITTYGGSNHFIRQKVNFGILSARTEVYEVSETVGREGVNQCMLIESKLGKSP